MLVQERKAAQPFKTASSRSHNGLPLLYTLNELADMLEHVELANLDFIEIQGHRLLKNPGRGTVFDRRGARSILRLIDSGVALASEVQERSDHTHSGLCTRIERATEGEARGPLAEKISYSGRASHLGARSG